MSTLGECAAFVYRFCHVFAGRPCSAARVCKLLKLAERAGYL